MNRDDTNFLRFIAICLVINSHLDLYYPIAHIGTGGAIGNALFFMLSAFGLLLSENKKPQTFIGYCAKRARRIYPTVWAVLFFLVFPLYYFQNSIDLKTVFLLPVKCLYPPFWFLQVLLLNYLIGFFLIKNYSKRKIGTVMVATFLLYLYFYLNHIDLTVWSVEKMPFKTLFYTMVFIFGIYLASINDKIKFSGATDVIICFAFIFFIYGHKLLLSKHLLSNLQALQQLMIVVVVYYALKISRSSFVRERIMQLSIIGPTARYISRITLELYIVHVTISPIVLHRNLLFPLNAIIFLLATFSIAALINLAVGKTLHFASSRFQKKPLYNRG
jgi:peptidoglycan/LPS O-acetylase OafA/YrhL